MSKFLVKNTKKKRKQKLTQSREKKQNMKKRKCYRREQKQLEKSQGRYQCLKWRRCLAKKPSRKVKALNSQAKKLDSLLKKSAMRQYNHVLECQLRKKVWCRNMRMKGSKTKCKKRR